MGLSVEDKVDCLSDIPSLDLEGIHLPPEVRERLDKRKAAI